ncbi:MAG: HAMP domain-containing histidine kinase [Saprospiraceae bacterium]|nr:HAMP domain-containing histidine kinase [Saprospiraceae bacterium]MBK7738623.1 HAMP domain-containing histidine kinase [Saprospiraceae bacterium]MBK7912805.1 HAMP domain-containing histidine kinase [Saprospiraceae bacterium]
MTSGKITAIIILSVLIILGILGMQAYFIKQNFNKEEASFHQSVSIALRNAANGIAKYNKAKLTEKGLIVRESGNFYLVNVNTPVDQSVLAVLLETEFDKQGINIPFEYGIYDCSTNELIYSDCCNVPGKKKITNKKKKASKTDITNYFVVRFPEKESFVYQKLGYVIFFSGLILAACLTLAGAIFIILRQKRYSDLMRDFVNNMTHEFKTPISSIKISADVLLNHPLIEEDKRLLQYAQIIKDQNQRLNDQVEKVLQIAKMESSSFSLRKEEMDIHENLKEICNQLQMRIRDTGGTMEYDLKALNHKVKADRFHMMNVFSNLLDNAVKYSKDQPHIKVRTVDQNGSCLLEIEDQGIGIQKDELPYLFQKFYRVSTGDVHNVKGFGIGLYYVKRICDEHGFELSIDSEYNKGTIVRILLKNSYR